MRQCVSGQFKSGAVASNAMSGLVKAYVKFDQLKPHIANACEAIKDYMAIFIFEDGKIGSGTFIRTGGLSGLLTAWHVAEHLSNFQEFVLCATDSPHRLSISSDLMDHVPIGVVPQGSMPEEGPDLSFLIIRDEGLLEKLRTIKSFYPLDSSRSPCIHPLLNQKIWWGVAGSPGESLKRSHENYQGGPLTRLLNFVGADRFPFQMFEKGDFDYLQLTVSSGHAPFPKDYDGMSGGGFWTLPMEIDPSGEIRHRTPILAGVEFAQSAWQNGERILTGHGSRSIYACLRRALKTHICTPIRSEIRRLTSAATSLY
jgi:hypothetical protein